MLLSASGKIIPKVILPWRVDLFKETVVFSNGKFVKMPLEHFFVDPKCLSQKGLISAALEAVRTISKEKTYKRFLDCYSKGVESINSGMGFTVKDQRLRLLKGYLDAARTDEYKQQIPLLGSKYLKRVGKIIKDAIGLGTLMYFDDNDMRLNELFCDIFVSDEIVYANSRSRDDPLHDMLIMNNLSYVYACFKEIVKIPAEKDIKFRKTIDYLRYIYLNNQKAASKIYYKFVYNFVRDIGLLHGIGGHFGGRDKDEFRGAGAIGGGALHPRNTTITGTKCDIDAHVYVPVIGIYTVGENKNKRYLNGLQAADNKLAIETIQKFRAIIIGEHNKDLATGDFNRIHKVFYAKGNNWASNKKNTKKYGLDNGGVEPYEGFLRALVKYLFSVDRQHDRLLRRLHKSIFVDFFGNVLGEENYTKYPQGMCQLSTYLLAESIAKRFNISCSSDIRLMAISLFYPSELNYSYHNMLIIYYKDMALIYLDGSAFQYNVIASHKKLLKNNIIFGVLEEFREIYQEKLGFSRVEVLPVSEFREYITNKWPYSVFMKKINDYVNILANSCDNGGRFSLDKLNDSMLRNLDKIVRKGLKNVPDFGLRAIVRKRYKTDSVNPFGNNPELYGGFVYMVCISLRDLRFFKADVLFEYLYYSFVNLVNLAGKQSKLFAFQGYRLNFNYEEIPLLIIFRD